MHQQLFVVLQMPFILGQTALLVRPGQYPPLRYGHAQRVRQRLENQTPIVRAVAQPPQGVERERMGGVVGKVEAAVEGELDASRIRQPAISGRQQARELTRIGRLGLILPMRSRFASSVDIVAADQHQSGLAGDASRKTVHVTSLALPFGRRHQIRMDGAPQRGLRCLRGFVQRRIVQCFGDHHQVDVAGRLRVAACHRAVDEGHADLVRQRRQRLLQREGQADAFANQTGQLGKHGRPRIGLVVLLVARARNRHQPRLCQAGEQAVNRPRAGLGQAGSSPL